MSLAAFLRNSGKRLLWGACLVVGPLSSAAWAGPTAEQALGLVPVQKEVDFEKPTGDEVAKCTIDVEKSGTISGWIVKDANGAILRRFLDTNGDNTVDQWSYFADGLEVYRDIDTNANGKADQCRWLNTGGSRWGLDTNEDGKIDSWKSISAEEVSSEAVQAMAARDAARFQRLLLTSEELKSLGLGDKYTTLIGDKLAAAPKRFTGLVSDSKIATVATGSTKWLNFSGTRPGLVPAGTEGSTKDLLVYENVAAMMDAGGKAGQVQIGTMIRVGDAWRLIDVPLPVDAEQQVAVNTVFFNAPAPVQTAIGGGSETAAGKEIFDDLQEIEAKLAKATPAEVAGLKKQRADLIERALPTLKETSDRVLWTRQLIDSLSEGVQTNTYPEGLTRLKDLEKKLALGSDKELVSYARFSAMTAEYILAQSDSKADFTKVQSTWLENLRGFVKEHPKSSETSEALLHLAIDSEFAGKEDDAKKLYAQIATEFPQSTAAKKATGAARRLDAIGKQLPLTGTTADGKQFNLTMYAGKPVAIYYFATNGATTAGDVAMIKQVQAKYARDLQILGISLDGSRADLIAYLQQHKLPWVNLFEEGGMDNRFANEMGILTIPTILLVDQSGKVVNRSVHVTELDKEVGNFIRR
jgi:hypothetical protein